MEASEIVDELNRSCEGKQVTKYYGKSQTFVTGLFYNTYHISIYNNPEDSKTGFGNNEVVHFNVGPINLEQAVNLMKEVNLKITNQDMDIKNIKTGHILSPDQVYLCINVTAEEQQI